MSCQRCRIIGHGVDFERCCTVKLTYSAQREACCDDRALFCAIVIGSSLERSVGGLFGSLGPFLLQLCRDLVVGVGII